LVLIEAVSHPAFGNYVDFVDAIAGPFVLVVLLIGTFATPPLAAFAIGACATRGLEA
jgi:hypothetical protein